MVRAFEYFTSSRTLYSKLRVDYELPSISTLTRLTSKVSNTEDETFINSVFSKLEGGQKNCMLLIDEVYVKKSLSYHGGSLFGKAINCPNSMATTVLGFMIVTMFGGPKFLYKMLPVFGLDADFLYDQTQKIISQIRQAQGNLVSIICDNNRVIHKNFEMFNLVSPWRTVDDIFLLFDFVHIFKCVRNNWITEKTGEIKFHHDNEEYVAKWEDIIKLQKSEDSDLVKMSKLTYVAANPKPIERQKVETCLKVFCDETCSALKLNQEMQTRNVDGTVLFLKKFIKFWKIVNVKSPFEGVRLNDENRTVINTPDDPRLKFLLELADFAADHTGPQSKRWKQFTRDTGRALEHTCRAFVDLVNHLLANGWSYVMLGIFTTDWLEKVFGKLRQGSGGTYFINVQQILEKVNIMKTKLLLNLDIDVDSFNVESGHSCDKCGYLLSEEACEVFDMLPELEKSLSQDVKSTLTYIAGYIVRKDENLDDTHFYFEKYGDFTDDLNRGGLTIPGDSVCQWVFFSYTLFFTVASCVCRTSLCNLLMVISEAHGFNMERRHGMILANILLNRYSYLYTPTSDKEPKQKLLKLS